MESKHINLQILPDYIVDGKNNKGQPSIYKGQSGCYIVKKQIVYILVQLFVYILGLKHINLIVQDQEVIMLYIDKWRKRD